jgi:hypothetical protein
VTQDANGGVAFVTWFDSQLQEPCWFVPASDGENRCVPYFNPYASEGVFSDSACTQAATEVEDTCQSPRHAYRVDSTVCPMRYRVYSLGAKLGTTEYRKNGSSCTPQAVQSGSTLYAVGAEVGAASLARGTLQKASGSTGIGIDVLTTDDGARGSDVYRELAEGFDCRAEIASDGSTHCIPADYAYSSNEFSDSQCTGAAYRVQQGCAPPKFGMSSQGPSQGCAWDQVYQPLGAAVTAPYQLSGTTCSVETPTSGWQLYSSAGTSRSLLSFAAATASATSAGRLSRVTLTWPGGKRTNGIYRDTQLDTECIVWETAADGSRRCMPWTRYVYVGTYFGDASCARPLALATLGCRSPKFALSFFDSCGPRRTRAYRVGSPHTGSVWTGGNGTCSAATAPASYQLFDLLSEVQPSEMAPLTEVLQ